MGRLGAAEPSLHGGGRRASRKRRWLPFAVVLAAAVAVWAAACVGALRRAQREAAAGVRLVREAEGLTSPRELEDARALVPLGRARASFERARAHLESPVLRPLRLVPGVAQHLQSATALARAGADVAETARSLAADVRSLLARPRHTGPARVGLLRDVADAAATAEKRLAAVRLGPSRFLAPPLAGRRRELADRLDDARAALRSLGRVAGGLSVILEGPRRYLLLGANNAEMRAGSGMFLSVGDVRFANGDIALGVLEPTAELQLPEGVAPEVEDADVAARWGAFTPSAEWRNLAMTPRFPATARLASRMWAAAGRGEVDGVVALDPVALRAVLRATGPVVAGDLAVSASTVVDLLLHDQYEGLDHSVPEHAARKERLGGIAQATVAALRERPLDLRALASGLAEAARGRHLLAWSPRPDDGPVWEGAGVSGRLGPSSLMVSVLNRGGNKLDPFLEVRARLDLQPAPGGGRASLRVSLRNTVPEGEAAYIAGPHPDTHVAPGTYLGLLTVNLPGSARQVQFQGEQALYAAGADGPTRVFAVAATVEPGTERTFTLRFRLARRHPLRIEPSARQPPPVWSVAGREWVAAGGREVDW